MKTIGFIIGFTATTLVITQGYRMLARVQRARFVRRKA